MQAELYIHLIIVEVSQTHQHKREKYYFIITETHQAKAKTYFIIYYMEVYVYIPNIFLS